METGENVQKKQIREKGKVQAVGEAYEMKHSKIKHENDHKHDTPIWSCRKERLN